MATPLYDRPEFFSAYVKTPRQTQGLAGAPEWKTVREILPALAGKRILDLGCGFGWFARWAREEGGAQAVLGIDLSQNMLARARQDTADPAVEYRIEDLATLKLAAASFDLVYSSLAFHYVEDFAKLVREIYEALTPESYLIFTIEHPIFMAATHADWTTDADGRKTWPVNSYGREGKRVTEWFAPGVVKYHRTLATTINTLLAAGFILKHVDEFASSPDHIVDRPDLQIELERPEFLILSAQKP